MPKKIVEIPLESGGVIYAEIEDASTRGLAPAARGGAMVEKASEALETMLEPIKGTAQAVINVLNTEVKPPKKIEIEFGLKLSGELGAIFASSKAEGNISIKLTWEN